MRLRFSDAQGVYDGVKDVAEEQYNCGGVGKCHPPPPPGGRARAPSGDGEGMVTAFSSFGVGAGAGCCGALIASAFFYARRRRGGRGRARPAWRKEAVAAPPPMSA